MKVYLTELITGSTSLPLGVSYYKITAKNIAAECEQDYIEWDSDCHGSTKDGGRVYIITEMDLK